MKREREVTRCCQAPALAEPIYEVLKGGRRHLADIVACSKCHRTMGDMRADPAVVRPLKLEEWMRMEMWRPRQPPYYFVAAPDGRLLPEGWKDGAAPQAAG